MRMNDSHVGCEEKEQNVFWQKRKRKSWKKQEEGTPFTHSGADRIKSLGIKTIVLPLVAVIISAVIYEIFGLTHSGDWNNAFIKI